MSSRLLALYPRAWRDRYGDEVVSLTDELVADGQTTRLRASLDLAAGAAAQRWRAGTHHRAVLPAAVAVALLAGMVGITLALALVLHGRSQPYFGVHEVGLVLTCVEMVWLALEVVAFVRAPRRGDWPADRTAWTALSSCVVVTTVAGNLAPAVVPAAALRPGGAAFAAGIAVVVAGVGLRWWSLRTGADVTRPAGPHRVLRHPQRAGVLVAVTGIGLASANWVGLAMMTLPPLLLLLWRIRVAERALAEHLGDRYGDYVRDRKRLVPLVW